MKFTIRKVNNDYNNDPLALAANIKAEERMYLEEVFSLINEIDFRYDWFKYFFMKCTKKKETILLRQKYFECAETFVDYYMDISTFFQKMIEIDIIKHLNYNSEQRQLLTYCSNPNFSFRAQDKLKEKLYDTYNRASLIDNQLDSQLTTIILNANQDVTSKKIIDLIQNNNIIFFD